MVDGFKPKIRAISLLHLPSATSFKTSSSRGLRRSNCFRLVLIRRAAHADFLSRLIGTTAGEGARVVSCSRRMGAKGFPTSVPRLGVGGEGVLTCALHVCVRRAL